MAVCSWCRAEMSSAQSCMMNALHVDGKRIDLLPYGREPGMSRPHGRCGDCGVEPGWWHHLGCDQQCCPVCRRQMITCGCRFDEDGPEEDELDEDELDEDELDEDGLDDFWIPGLEPSGVDGNGLPVARAGSGDNSIIVHYDDIPESDITVLHGIRTTTPLRTVIDIAPDIDPARLAGIVFDCLERRMFTVDEAWQRLRQPDMAGRRGARMLAGVLQTIR